MQKKIFLTITTMIISIFFGIGNVSALDSNDYKITANATTGNAGSGLTINVEGEFEENASYYVKFVNKASSKPTDFPSNWTDSVDSDINNISKWKFVTKVNKEVSINDDWYLLNGYDYAYILKCNTNKCDITDNPIYVERPSLPELGKRYQLYFLDGKLSVYPYFPFIGKNGSHKINVKIGIINDYELLKSISRSETGSLEKLLGYAKENSGDTFTVENDAVKNYLDIGNYNVVEGKYYYIYTDYENNDGMYRDLSDIAVVMGKNYEGKACLANDLEWNFDNEASVKIIKNPKTLDVNIYIIGTMVIMFGSLIILGVKKLKKKN